MKNRTFLFLTGTIVALVGGVTEVGCSSKSDTTPAQGAPATGSGGTGATSSGTRSSSASTGKGTGGGTTTGSASGGGGAGETTAGTGGDTSSTTGTGGGGGNVGTDCAASATANCKELKTCNPNIFAVTYGDSATCVDALTTGCNNAKPLDGENGVANSAACLAAKTASCTAYLSVNQPAACKPKAGKLKDGVSCVVNDQCVSGEYCYNDEIAGDCHYCAATTAPGDPCQNTFGSDDSNLCDSSLGQQCAGIFDATNGVKTTGATPDTFTCQVITYGAAGADCFAGSNKQCDTGLGLTCSQNKKCVALLGVNQTCITTTDCDTSQGLSCQTVKGVSTCQPSVIVPVGATCGMVLAADGVTMELHSCAASQAICSTDGTTKCIALVKKGEVCINQAGTPGSNCEQYTGEGLVCTAGTCQLPTAPTACTPVPQQ